MEYKALAVEKEEIMVDTEWWWRCVDSWWDISWLL